MFEIFRFLLLSPEVALVVESFIFCCIYVLFVKYLLDS